MKNDSINCDYVLSIFENRIFANIDKIVRHKDFPKKGSKLFEISPDKKLFHFSLDMQGFGSYRSRFSVLYYMENNKIIYKAGYGDTLIVNGIKEVEGNFNAPFHSDGYGRIDTIQTNNGVKYLLQGAVKTCNTCLTQYITLVKFENGKPVSEFDYDLEFQFERDVQFEYDAKTKTITIAFERDDVSDSNYDEYSKEVYTFNGETFELTEDCWKKTKKDKD